MSGTGGPEVLQVRDVARPRPQRGEILLRTEAVPVLYPETLIRAGVYPAPATSPQIFGIQAVGVVAEVGAGADPRLRGQRVLVAGTGTWAEWVCAPADSAVPVPDGLDPENAAAVAMSCSVALTLLDAAAASSAETVLVEAAATGVGGYLTQLARRNGAGTVIATAGGQDKTERARELGADEVIDHRDPDWPQRLRDLLGTDTVDLVFDAVGGPSAAALLDVMTPLRGRMLGYGWLSGAPAQVTTMDLIMRGLSFTGCSGPDWLAAVAERRARALELAATGAVTVLIDRVLPLDRATEAHRLVDQRATLGTIVLRPTATDSAGFSR